MLKNSKIIHFLFGCLVVITTWLYLLGFFPNSQGAIGHDYSNFLSILLEGRIWFDKHGFAIEWFTPAFGGGLPKFPDPQNMQYSIPQLIANFTSPLTALKISFGILLSVGYLFCFKSMRLLTPDKSTLSAHLMAILFIVNSFFLTRMMIGHLTYHVYMLLPLSLYLFIKSLGKQPGKFIFLQSLVLGYLFYGGAGNYAPMYFISLILTTFTCTLYLKQSWLHNLKVFYSLILSLIIAAPQILATLSFLKYFPRDHIANPMYSSLWHSIYYNLKMLFWGPIRTTYALPEQISSPSFLLEQHELEFSITFIPLIILILVTYYIFKDKLVFSQIKHHSLHTSVAIITGFFIAFSILMWSNPLSNWAMKSLPYLKNLSSLLRGLSIFIFPLLIISILSLTIINERIKYLKKVVVLLSLTIPLMAVQTDFYKQQTLRPDIVEIAYSKYIHQEWSPQINGISGREGITNQHFVFNKSSMYPYQPIFGYRLENYPGKQLYISSPLSYTPNLGYNFLNPVCMVFPELNNCPVGEHFQNRNELKMFIKYEKFNYEIPNYINLSIWVSLVYIGVGLLFMSLGKRVTP